MTSSLEFQALPPRVSDAERERALELLRESAVDGRVSHHTFERRTDLVLHAHYRHELDAALGDLESRRPRLTERLVARTTSFPRRLRQAWRTQRLPQLMLPVPGPHPLTIGRAPGSMLRLTDITVSRAHAQLRSAPEGWSLRDLGSSNGTWVNGSRVSGRATVRPGDEVRFGQVAFRLTSPWA